MFDLGKFKTGIKYFLNTKLNKILKSCFSVAGLSMVDLFCNLETFLKVAIS